MHKCIKSAQFDLFTQVNGRSTVLTLCNRPNYYISYLRNVVVSNICTDVDTLFIKIE